MMHTHLPSDEPTAFRIAEKYFKSRTTPLDPRRRKKLLKLGHPIGLPDLTHRGVLDLSRGRWTTSDQGLDSDLLAEGSGRRMETEIGKDSERDEVFAAGWILDQDRFGGRETEVRQIRLVGRAERDGSLAPERIGYIVGDGLVLFPKYFSPSTQLSLLSSSLSEYTLPPNPLNLSTHYSLPTQNDQDSLFEMYSRDTQTLIPTLTSLRSGSTSNLSNDASTISSSSSTVKTKREPISNPPATALGYSHILNTVKEWKGDEPSEKLKDKTAKELVEKELRWANLGWVYNWTNKAYDFTTSTPIPFPPVLKDICRSLVGSVPWKEVYGAASEQQDEGKIIPDWEQWADDYAPDTGIVNFYQMKDTLMGHVDRSELDPYRPLVSISIGHAAIFLVGGPDRDVPPIPIVLRSGDALIMSGRSRSYYHGVPRIMEGTLPAHFLPAEDDDSMMAACKRFISTARININARQVFPAGFERPME